MKTYIRYNSNAQIWDYENSCSYNQKDLIDKKRQGEEFRVLKKDKITGEFEDVTSSTLANAVFYKYRHNEEFQRALIKMFFEDHSELDFMSYDELFKEGA